MTVRVRQLQPRSAAGPLVAALAVGIALVVSVLPARGPSSLPVTRSHRPADVTAVGRHSPTTTTEAPRFSRWVDVEDFPTGIAQFRTVFWEPADTESLRKLIRETDLVHGKRVLEIGTGTGLVALCCLTNEAGHVVATDINQHAIVNARYNAARFPVTSGLETRLVGEGDPGAFAVIGADERFDLILSNPPWEDGKPDIVDEYALYDPEFTLLESLLAGLEDHLAPDGRVLLAYGCVEAIRVLQQRAPVHGWQVELRDPRNLDELPNLFLPGMLLELKRSAGNGPNSDTIDR